jgi:hypothetical protein
MKKRFNTDIKVKLIGHIKIFEYESQEDYDKKNGKLLLSKRNAIHDENASILIARGITHRPNGNISYMYFGNGGATIDPLGNVILNTPNVTGAADLYHTTFFQFIDDTEGAPPGDNMAVRHINGTLFSDADMRCLIPANQPFGQLPSDGTGPIDLNTQSFSFNEIALKTADLLLISMVTFVPILKTANRLIEVVYTYRIAIAN